MSAEIKQLAAALNAANAKLKKSVGPRGFDREAYKAARAAYHEFWTAADAAKIPTKEAAKLVTPVV